eukprot:scaffold566_cov364-Pavlova_lutheri.AAC.23
MEVQQSKSQPQAVSPPKLWQLLRYSPSDQIQFWEDWVKTSNIPHCIESTFALTGKEYPLEWSCFLSLDKLCIGSLVSCSTREHCWYGRKVCSQATDEKQAYLCEAWGGCLRARAGVVEVIERRLLRNAKELGSVFVFKLLTTATLSCLHLAEAR